MEDKMIPYIAHESEVARLERIIKRLWILCIIIFVALIATNGAWLWYESQWEDVVVSQEVDTGNGNAVVSGTGDITYGESEANSKEAAEEDGR